MKSIQVTGGSQLTVIDCEMPKSDGVSVIVKVTASGICGSDLHLWAAGDMCQGLIMGHEFSGTVIDPGARKDELKVGDRVTAIPLNYCGKCKQCENGDVNICPTTWLGALGTWVPGVGFGAPGANAEYVAVRPDLIRKLPDRVSDLEGAMIEPAAVGLHAVRLADVQIGDKVLITGAGIIGLLCAAMARRSGASYVAITEANMLRGKKAVKFGDVDAVFDAKDPDVMTKLAEASNGGFDKAFDCAAVSASVNTALAAVKPGGKVIFVGVAFGEVPVPSVLTVSRELEIKGSIAYSIDDFEKVIDLIANKKIDLEQFVDEIAGIDDVQNAFEQLSSGSNPKVKVILKL